MNAGKFITFEGGEGGGKTTQLSLLARGLEALDIEVLTTREPGGTAGAEEIRNLLVNGEVDRWEPLSEALLHYAARVEHVEKTVRPALEAGIWVLCDRFADSTVAYQGGGHGLGLDKIKTLQDLTLGSFKPDLTVVLDIDVEEGLARAFNRAAAEDRYERMDLGFHQRIRAAFLEIADAEPARCVVVDAGPSAEDVHAQVGIALRDRLGVALPELTA